MTASKFYSVRTAAQQTSTVATHIATSQETRIATNSARVDYHVDNATTKE